MAEPSSRRRLLDTLELSDDYNIILTTRPRGAIPASLLGLLLFIFIGNGGPHLSHELCET